MLNTEELESTIIDRLTEYHIRVLAANNVVFFYDKLLKESFRIDLVGEEVVVTLIPKNLGE
jgi:uncharacterized membrane protein